MKISDNLWKLSGTQSQAAAAAAGQGKTGGEQGEQGVIFCGSKIVLQLLLLCEYCHYNAYYCEVHQAVMRKSSVLLPFGGFSCLLLLSLWTSSNLSHLEKALLSLVCNAGTILHFNSSSSFWKQFQPNTSICVFIRIYGIDWLYCVWKSGFPKLKYLLIIHFLLCLCTDSLQEQCTVGQGALLRLGEGRSTLDKWPVHHRTDAERPTTTHNDQLTSYCMHVFGWWEEQIVQQIL